MTEFIFTIDGGGTKTRAVLYSIEGVELVKSSAGAGNLLRGADKVAQIVGELWQVACKTMGSASSVLINRTTFAAGLAGAQFKHDRDIFKAGLPDFNEKIVCSDGYAALMAATKGKSGTLIVVGTGVAGHKLNEDGTTTDVGGWGFPLGDIGGGAWLGWKAASNYVQWLDERSLNSAMWDEIAKVIGARYGDILKWSQNATPSKFGKLAPIVVKAMKGGDSVANEIFFEGLHGIYLMSMSLKSHDETCFYSGGLSGVVMEALNARYFGAHASLSADSANWGAFLVGTGKAPMEQFEAYSSVA